MAYVDFLFAFQACAFCIAHRSLIATDERRSTHSLHIRNSCAIQDVQLNGTIAGDIERRPNHRWNPVRGEEFGLNAQTLERRLHDKIRENFTVRVAAL